MTNISKNNKIQNLKIYLMIFLLIFVPTILVIKMNNKKKLNNILNNNETNIKKILVQKIKPEKRKEIFEYSGILEPKEIVNVISQANGIIDEILVSQGERVVKGQVLIKIEEQEKKAEFERAQQLLKQKNDELKNNQKLFKEKIISKTKLEESITSEKEAIANLEKAKKNLDFTKILAPIDGYIDKINFKVGDHLGNSTSAPITKIFSDKQFIISIFVSQNNIFQIKKNQLVNFSINFHDNSQEKIVQTGKVDFISNLADKATRTYYTEILIDQIQGENNNHLAKAIGSSVNVKIQGNPKDSININDSIVFLDDNGHLIAKVLNKDNIVKFLKIKPIDNINSDARSWYSIDEKSVKSSDFLLEDGSLNLIVRGGGFLQENESVNNFDYLATPEEK